MKPYVLFLPLSLVLWTSCGSEPSRRAAPAQSAPIAVRTAPAAVTDWPAVYSATGTVRARTTAAIAAKVMGYIQQVNVQVGDHVRAGQTLITLDARDLEANVRRAEAGRAEVQSALPELEQATAAAKANLDLAQTTFHRMEELNAKKSISSQEFDEASARLKAAQANYEMVRARRAQISSKTTTVEEEARAARIMAGYATLAAPFAGIVTTRNAEPGSLASPGVPLLTIEQEGGFRLEAAVDESRLALVRTGQSVEVALDTDPRTLTARVTEIVPAVDAASRTNIVKLDLPAAAGLRTGVFGRASFPMPSAQALTIPAAALIERGQIQSVFVVEDGTARTRLVTTGRRQGDVVEILSGLAAAEAVVVPVPAGLQDGARVEVRR
jgi:RND family efflux transporter MFP subunit